MPTHLHVRDVPDEIHRTLVRRAADRGMSLRSYTLEVLTEHCALPTLGEWLDGLERLRPARAGVSAGKALAEARETEDAEIFGAGPGR